MSVEKNIDEGEQKFHKSFPRNFGPLAAQQTNIKVTTLAIPGILSRISRHQLKKIRLFIEGGLAYTEICTFAFENIEGSDKVNSAVSAFQREEPGRWSSTLVTGRI